MRVSLLKLPFLFPENRLRTRSQPSGAFSPLLTKCRGLEDVDRSMRSGPTVPGQGATEGLSQKQSRSLDKGQYGLTLSSKM